MGISIQSAGGAAREGRRSAMDEKKTADREETAPQGQALTDQEAEEAAGGKRPPASVYHDKPFF